MGSFIQSASGKDSGEKHKLWNPLAQVHSPTPSPPRSVTVSKLFEISMPQFPHPGSGVIRVAATRVLMRSDWVFLLGLCCAGPACGKCCGGWVWWPIVHLYQGPGSGGHREAPCLPLSAEAASKQEKQMVQQMESYTVLKALGLRAAQNPKTGLNLSWELRALKDSGLLSERAGEGWGGPRVRAVWGCFQGAAGRQKGLQQR